MPSRKQPVGSCEISIVDADGNWLQMMNTVQSGGIPGMAVGGVTMMGSHEQTAMNSHFANWRVPGARMRNILGNTFVLRDGAPWLALGTPGNVYATVPQMLVNILDFGMTPGRPPPTRRACCRSTDDYGLTVESRLSPEAITGLAALGVHILPMPAWDWIDGLVPDVLARRGRTADGGRGFSAHGGGWGALRAGGRSAQRRMRGAVSHHGFIQLHCVIPAHAGLSVFGKTRAPANGDSRWRGLCWRREPPP